MKLNAHTVSCISHTWFVYIVNTIFYQHNIYMEVHAPNLFWTSPFCCLEIPPPTSWKPSLYLLGNPSFVSWREFPSTLVPGWLYTDPPPPTPPFPFPLSPSQRFPLLMHALSRRHCDIGFTESDTTIILRHELACYSTYDSRSAVCISEHSTIQRVTLYNTKLSILQFKAYYILNIQKQGKSRIQYRIFPLIQHGDKIKLLILVGEAPCGPSKYLHCKSKENFYTIKKLAHCSSYQHGKFNLLFSSL